MKKNIKIRSVYLMIFSVLPVVFVNFLQNILYFEKNYKQKNSIFDNRVINV